MQLIQKYWDFINESSKHSFGIKQKQVEKTISHIKEHLISLLRLDEESIAFVGSAGKRDQKEISYNINLGLHKKTLLEKNNVDKTEIFEFIEKQINRLGYDCKINEDKKEVSVDWPIEGDVDKGTIELKLKLSDNLKWYNFARYSPIEGEESKYYSKYRHALFEAIAETIKTDIVEYFDVKDSVKEFEQYILDIDEGLHLVSKSFLGKHGVLKKAEIIDETKRMVTDDPVEFTKILFGKDVKPEDVMTLEKCMKIIKNDDYIHKKKRKRIFEKFKRKLVGMRLVIPEGLM